MTPSDCIRLDHLQTEERSARAHLMGSLDKSGLLIVCKHGESRVYASVAGCLAEIAPFVDDLVPRLHTGGQLIYIGASNNDTIALMENAKIPVEFSTEEDQAIALVAGGKGTIIRAQEDSEDAETDGAAQLEPLTLKPNNPFLEITASDQTFLVLGALEFAFWIKALTASITKISPSLVGELCIDVPPVSLLSQEGILGRNKIKAGSAAKQVLKMISTGLMIKIGKTYGGLMIDFRVGNHKLQARARRIMRQTCRELMGQYSKRAIVLPSPIMKTFLQMQNVDAANDLIRRYDGCGKLARAVTVTNSSPNEAISQLQNRGGDFGALVANHPDLIYLNDDIASVGYRGNAEYFLAIDGGGTKCAVSISTKFGVVSRGYAGPCNCNTVTANEVISQVKKATMDAIRHLSQKGFSRPNKTPRFCKVWAGLAGLNHADKLQFLTCNLEKLLGVSVEAGSLRLTSDSALLGACLEMNTSTQTAISIISGTGSVATAFKKEPNGHAVAVRRTGGWGHLIGDDGSAFDIGKQALQAFLTSVEINEADNESCLTEMEGEVLAYFGCTKKAVLSHLLYSGKNPTSEIGGLAKIVTRLAFRDGNSDSQALEILRTAAKSLTQLILPLKATCPPQSSVLILSGALMTIANFRELIYDQFSSSHINAFKDIIVINSVSDCVANFLAAQAI